MLIDTHCHINSMVKKDFDVLLTNEQLQQAEPIIREANSCDVQVIINVGTSLMESKNCLALALHYPNNFATVGIHPNDCTTTWRADIREVEKLIQQTTPGTIVGIGECGIDRHYPDYDLIRQTDAFKAQIELALTYDLALVVHSRDAYDETLRVLEPYQHNITRGVIHCFSYDQAFADTAQAMGFVIGLGGAITYPKNEGLRDVTRTIPDDAIVLETDAPFLPIQKMRGKKNHPRYIKDIAEFIAELRQTTPEEIARITTKNAQRLFKITPSDS